MTHNLSITTFRYVPVEDPSEEVETFLNELNQELLTRLEQSGEAFLSNALIGSKFALRACIVNFRTSLEDLGVVIEVVTRLGREVYRSLGSP